MSEDAAQRYSQKMIEMNEALSDTARACRQAEGIGWCYYHSLSLIDAHQSSHSADPSPHDLITIGRCEAI